MKKLSKFVLLFIFAALTFSSCTKDENWDPITFSIDALTDNEAWRGDTVSWTVIASSTEDIDEFSISSLEYPNQGYSSEPKESEVTHLFTIVVPGNAQDGDIITFTVTATDKNSTETTTFQLTIKEPTSPLTNNQSGQFHHIQGPATGAYDLVNDIEMSKSDDDAKKDLKNTDEAGNPFTGSWETGTGNTTMYVKAANFDYANASIESVSTEYNAGTPTSIVTNPSAGDIYLAKLRDGNYTAIKILSVDASFDPTGTAGNTGKITFEYKK